jgi:hypothetical protein
VVFSIETIIIYALPVLLENKTLGIYTETELNFAAIEVLLFCFALTLGWKFAFNEKTTQRPIKRYYRIRFISLQDHTSLERTAVTMIMIGGFYQIVSYVGLLEPIFANVYELKTLITNIAQCIISASFLIAGYAIGVGVLKKIGAGIVWMAYALHFILNSSTILLSSNSAIFLSLALGYAIGARRAPWVLTITTIATLTFLNLGKFEMRNKYWEQGIQVKSPSLAELPGFFSEWAISSMDVMTRDKSREETAEAEGQNITDRVNNMQNLLYAQAAMAKNNIEPLYGATYIVIPALLIPRIMWPDKPRTHEGQVILNVRFGRQDLESTFSTYIAWGLLAEAYANFGPGLGPIACGIVIGWLIGKLERFVRPYPATSLEFFFFLLIGINFILSFEMVASVWVTCLFQSLCALCLACLPFTEKAPVNTGVI